MLKLFFDVQIEFDHLKYDARVILERSHCLIIKQFKFYILYTCTEYQIKQGIDTYSNVISISNHSKRFFLKTYWTLNG